MSVQNESRARRAWWWAVGICVVAGAIVFAHTKDYGLVGFDTYPIILTSRVHSFADFTGNFTERLMDGLYAAGFYRPAVNLSFALDETVWGLRAAGYHLTNAVLFAASALVLFLLVQRLAGPRAYVASFAALLFFLMHPAHWEVVPVPARRPELMCCLAVGLSLLLQLRPRALSRGRPPIAPAILMMVAIASKETAFVFPALSFLAVLLYTNADRFRERLKRAAVAMIPHAVVIAVLLAVRLAVLGELGGHDPSRTLGQGIAAWPGVVAALAAAMILPQTISHETSLGLWLLVGGGVGLVVTVMVSARHWISRRSSELDDLGRTAVFALGWMGLLSVVYAVAADKVEPWYLYLSIAAFAMLVGALGDALVMTFRSGNRLQKGAAGATMVILATWVAGQLVYSPFVHRYDQWPRATKASDEFLRSLQVAIEAAPDGSVIAAPPIPIWLQEPPGRARLAGVAVLHTYSIQAWAELAMPHRRVRVHDDASAPMAAPDEVVVVPVRILTDF